MTSVFNTFNFKWYLLSIACHAFTIPASYTSDAAVGAISSAYMLVWILQSSLVVATSLITKSMLPCLTPDVVSNHSPSPAPIFILLLTRSIRTDNGYLQFGWCFVFNYSIPKTLPILKFGWNHLTLLFSLFWNQNVPQEILFFIWNRYSAIARKRSITTAIIARVQIQKYIYFWKFIKCATDPSIIKH